MTPDEAILTLRDGSQHQALRASPEESWEVAVACPICGLQPLRCRGYLDELRREGGRYRAPAHCRGVHEPIGELSIEAPEGEQGDLLFMSVQLEEGVRARIYGGE